MQKIRVGRGLSGLGIFAERPFRRSDYIVQYTGRIIRKGEPQDGRYLMTGRGGSAIDATARRHIARYINHSCRPNAYVVLTRFNRLYIYAKRRIEIGDEITINYGKEYFDYFIGRNCRCEVCAPRLGIAA
jgi:SET domain-containing protein